ncbi:MAG TPA: hypothetical protein VMS54_13300 [Vicinamibacterales bacterium]|nr:hypothetical protein [Vicinamibacterales bacterium]
MTHTLLIHSDGRPVDVQRRDERADAQARIAEFRRRHDSKAVVAESKARFEAKYGTSKKRPSRTSPIDIDLLARVARVTPAEFRRLAASRCR